MSSWALDTRASASASNVVDSALASSALTLASTASSTPATDRSTTGGMGPRVRTRASRAVDEAGVGRDEDEAPGDHGDEVGLGLGPARPQGPLDVDRPPPTGPGVGQGVEERGEDGVVGHGNHHGEGVWHYRRLDGLGGVGGVHGRGRLPVVDLLRAGSLAVVVLWHWVFTIVFWRADGPHASNPIGTTRGLWLLTWLLQVMPLFFVVGGSVHARALQRRPSALVHRQRGALARRRRRGAVALATWIYLLVDTFWTAPPWLKGSLVLVLSPLWFLAVYLLLILVAPAAWKAHLRWGELVPIFLAGLAAMVDVARFTWEIPYAEWLNWLVVFGAAHQTGLLLGPHPGRARAASAGSSRGSGCSPSSASPTCASTRARPSACPASPSRTSGRRRW